MKINSTKFRDPLRRKTSARLLNQQFKDKLIEHKLGLNQHGEDLPEIRNWKWKTNHPPV